MSNEMNAETYWKDELVKLQREYQKLAQPILDRLVQLESLKPPKPVILDIGENPYLPEEYKQRLLALPKKERDKYLAGEFKNESETRTIFEIIDYFKEQLAGGFQAELDVYDLELLIPILTDWTNIKDVDRMDMLANDGFSIWQIIDNGVESWRCQYKIDEQHEGKTLREAMDKAIIAYRKENQNETDSNYHNNIGSAD